MRRSLLTNLLIGGLLASAQATSAPAVVASIKPIHSLVAGVTQGVTEPTLLVPAGQSPHTYSLTPSAARTLESADLVVWVGPSLESFLARPVANIAQPEASLPLTRAGGIELLATRRSGAWKGRSHEHGDEHANHGHSAERETNPHIWLDPDNAIAIVGILAERLSALDPEHADAYRRNAESMRARITETDRQVKGLLAPVRDTPYVVFHDAYHYFERHYGLNAVGSITLSPERKPGARRLVEIRRKIRKLDAQCVFREPQFSPDLVSTVIEDTQADLGTLDPLGAELEAGPAAYPELLTNLAADLIECLQPSP